MAAVRHLGFVWGIFGPPTVSTWGLGLCHSAKVGYDRCSSFYRATAMLNAVYAVVVCMCVCVCHTPVLYQNG